MHKTLGIHIGHNASCAVVVDGELVAAVQQERITRKKHDGSDILSERMPIAECLNSVSLTIDDIDSIVTSFQALSPGGIGLGKPIVSSGFSAFDRYDPRHVVISHHYAHALSALGCCGAVEGAAIVADLAGSTTLDGQDFIVPFAVFEQQLLGLAAAPTQYTECYSIFDFATDSYRLLKREFVVPHNAPDYYVQSAASLYDNVSRAIFRKENAHGQLMALASTGSIEEHPALSVSDIVTIAENAVAFRNDWQSAALVRYDVLDNVGVALVVQRALQATLLTYAREARALSDASTLVAAGGVFLNILANSDIAASGLFERFYVPSVPHDAGISAGCAFHGWRSSAHYRPVIRLRSSDRLGPAVSSDEIVDALTPYAFLIETNSSEPAHIARRLHSGQIIARCSGRSEFGPRALGGRSLLASPLGHDIKDRLNRLKGRQNWRPVAPIILSEKVSSFFDGPEDSPYMNFVHLIKEHYRDRLVALQHPDGSTRAQTLDESEDIALRRIIEAFEELSGFPIIVNTSFNGGGEPIVQTATQALRFFLLNPDVDALLIEDLLITRADLSVESPAWPDLALADGAVVTTVHGQGSIQYLLVKAGRALAVPRLVAERFIEAEGANAVPLVEFIEHTGRLAGTAVARAMLEGFVQTRSRVSLPNIKSEDRAHVVRLEALRVAHASEMFPLLADERLWTYTDGGMPQTEEALRQRYARQEGRLSPSGDEMWLNWIVRDCDSHRVSGFVQATIPIPGTVATISYVIGRQFWNRGIGTDAVRQMVEELTTSHRISRFMATVDSANTASIALLKRLGFSCEDSVDPRNLTFVRELARPSQLVTQDRR